MLLIGQFTFRLGLRKVWPSTVPVVCLVCRVRRGLGLVFRVVARQRAAFMAGLLVDVCRVVVFLVAVRPMRRTVGKKPPSFW